MKKTILVSLTILAVSTSAASAWTHRTHHGRAMNPNASVAAADQGRYARPANAYAMGGPLGGPMAPMQQGFSSQDHEMYMKNLHDSGYDPKNDRTATGAMKQQ